MISHSPVPRWLARPVAVILLMAAATTASWAQTQPPAQPPTATQTPSETFAALTLADRRALQSDLVWIGKFNGLINGEPSDRVINAIKAWQKDRNSQQTGVLNPKERDQLKGLAKQRQTAVGWRLLTDAPSGVRLGIPSKLTPQATSAASSSRWTAANGAVEITISRREDAAPTTAKLADAERTNPAGRKIEYSLVRPDFFVLSGLQGAQKFYLRGAFSGRQVRILTVLYDPAQDAVMQPIVVAMSSAFTPFPAATSVAARRKPVDYGTGVIVSGDGAILTDRMLVDACTSLVVAGHGNAERLAEDKPSGLALLQLYGANGLRPINLAPGPATQSVSLIGIADPQNQGGGNAVSRSAATVGPSASLSPAPGLGFSGAAAIDPSGNFTGMALMRSVVVAGAVDGVATNEATLVSAEMVRAFLRAQKIADPAKPATDPQAAVVRVICVRH